MRLIGLLLLLATGLSASVVTYTNFQNFRASSGPLQYEPVNETFVLFPLGDVVTFEFAPTKAAGLWIDTTPAGPGSGVKLGVQYLNDVVEWAGFWGGNGTNVIGFLGVVSTDLIKGIVLGTGTFANYGNKETSFVPWVKHAIDQDAPPASTPEPGTLAMAGISFLLMAIYGRSRRRP